MNDHSENTPPSPEDKFFSDNWVVITICVVLFIISTGSWLSGVWEGVEAIATVITVLIGSIMAFFGRETFFEIYITIESVGAILLWIVACIADLVMEGFTFTWIFTDILFGWILTIILCAFPALVGTILVVVLKKLVRT